MDFKRVPIDIVQLVGSLFIVKFLIKVIHIE